MRSLKPLIIKLAPRHPSGRWSAQQVRTADPTDPGLALGSVVLTVLGRPER